MKDRLVILCLIIILFSGNLFSQSQDKYKVFDKPCTLIKGTPESLLYDSTYLYKEFGFDKLLEVPAYYNGLKPRYKMVLGLYFRNYEKKGIKKAGGLAFNTICLIIKVKNEYVLIDSKQKVKEYFAPIKNQYEALSYIALLTNSSPWYEFTFIEDNFRIIKHDLNKTYVKSLSDGYEVHLFEYIEFGCEHPYLEITYKLDTLGNYEKIREEELFFDPEEDGFCRD